MATDDNDRPENNTDASKRSSGSGMAVADEGDMAIGAMTVIAVIIGIVIAMVAASGYFAV